MMKLGSMWAESFKSLHWSESPRIDEDSNRLLSDQISSNTKTNVLCLSNIFIIRNIISWGLTSGFQSFLERNNCMKRLNAGNQDL